MARPLDRGRLRQAFELLGRDLARRGLLVELAVYGGGALMLQFEWRRSTEDVDAVVRAGFDERLLAPSIEAVASEMELDSGWLNNAVGMYTALEENETLFEVGGSYPAIGDLGLRVFLANPRYLLAMKLCALASYDRGDKDMDDARKLAVHLGIADEEALIRLYVSIHDEEPPSTARLRFVTVLER